MPLEQQLSASIIPNQSSQLELEAGLEKPNDAKDVTPLADTTKASVPKNYDAHTKSGLVSQTGTEAPSQVGLSITDSLLQLAIPAISSIIPNGGIAQAFL